MGLTVIGGAISLRLNLLRIRKIMTKISQAGTVLLLSSSLCMNVSDIKSVPSYTYLGGHGYGNYFSVLTAVASVGGRGYDNYLNVLTGIASDVSTY